MSMIHRPRIGLLHGGITHSFVLSRSRVLYAEIADANRHFASPLFHSNFFSHHRHQISRQGREDCHAYIVLIHTSYVKKKENPFSCSFLVISKRKALVRSGLTLAVVAALVWRDSRENIRCYLNSILKVQKQPMSILYSACNQEKANLNAINHLLFLSQRILFVALDIQLSGQRVKCLQIGTATFAACLQI